MSIGKNSIERAAKAANGTAEKILPEMPKAPAKPAAPKVAKPATPAKKAEPKTLVIANISPEVVEKVAKPKKTAAKKEEFTKTFAIGDELPEFLL